MKESSISYPHLREETASFTTLREDIADSFERRLQKYDHEYERQDFFIQDSWDSAIFTMDRDVVRKPQLWIKPKSD